MAQVLRHLPVTERGKRDPKLLVGAETFDDAGIYQLTDDIALVQTIDFFPPLVDDPFVYGQIAAANALSDVYAMGGVPKTVLNLVGFPDDQLPLELLARILAGGQDRIDAAGAITVGGHTVRDAEIKYGLSVTGLVHPKEFTPNTAAKPGDALFLTKPLGTGFVTTANKRGKCPDEVLAAACQSMIELNKSASDAMKELGVRSATDITGFGLAGHAWEMAAGSGVTIEIILSQLPVIPGAEALAKQGFQTRASKTNLEYVAPSLELMDSLDQLQLKFFFDAQTSGGLLISVPPENATRAPEVLARHGTIVAAHVGDVIEKRAGIDLIVKN